MYTNGYWQFQQVQQNIYPPGQVVPSERRFTNSLDLPELTATPARIRSEIKVSSMSDLKAARGMSLSLAEILEYKRWHPERRRDPQLDTKLQARLAAPATCLVVVLIAVPFAARSGRRNVFVGVASSIFVGFAFFVLQGFGEAALGFLGEGGQGLVLAGDLAQEVKLALVAVALDAQQVVQAHTDALPAGKRGVEKFPPNSVCNAILKPFDLDRFLEIISECLEKPTAVH